jgi:hypothetical protein
MLHAAACGAGGFQSIQERGWKEIKQQHSNSRRGKQTHGILIYRMEVKE